MVLNQGDCCLSPKPAPNEHWETGTVQQSLRGYSILPRPRRGAQLTVSVESSLSTSQSLSFP